MRKLVLSLLIFTITNSFTTLCFANKNKIIVKIDDEIVTSYELKNKIKTLLVLANQNLSQENIDEVKQQALIQLINSKLKLKEVTKYSIEANESSVRNQLLNISSNNLPALKNSFLENNVNYDLFKDEIKIEMSWQKLIYFLYNKKINDEELKSQIVSFENSNFSREDFRIAEIEILIENQSEIKKKIELIKDQIKRNGFDNTAVKFSISNSSTSKGDLGWLDSKVISKKIYNILKNLKIGDVSEPIISPQNIVFLKLLDKKISKINKNQSNEYKERLLTQKKNELYNLYSTSHLSKLRNNSLIEYK
tara:strand:+ start:7440 stop:8360 length:921 start_codon:yes stop_codon:yes gene_type:complete